eukprot:m.405611 g.405611  ORF g.405611 m.405611 type:complete len:143 (+) comp28430_c0_seq8:3017-3445(+)
MRPFYIQFPDREKLSNSATFHPLRSPTMPRWTPTAYKPTDLPPTVALTASPVNESETTTGTPTALALKAPSATNDPFSTKSHDVLLTPRQTPATGTVWPTNGTRPHSDAHPPPRTAGGGGGGGGGGVCGGSSTNVCHPGDAK